MPRGRLPTGMAVITLFFAPSINVMSPPFSLLTHTRNEFAACEAQSKPDHKINPTRRVLFILIETLRAFRPADKQETDDALVAQTADVLPVSHLAGVRIF